LFLHKQKLEIKIPYLKTRRFVTVLRRQSLYSIKSLCT